MITLYTGKLGCGKSYSATKKAWKFVKEGKTVYANYHIDFTAYYKKKSRNPLWRLFNPKFRFGKVYYWSTLKDLSEIRNGEVFMDEAHMSIDARDFAKLDKDFKTKLTQSRKYGLNLHFITQHSQQIDVVVRRLSNYQVVHKKYWRLFTWREYDGEHIEHLANPIMMEMHKPKSTGFGFHWFSKTFAKSYDTFALFNPFKEYKVDPMWQLEEKKIPLQETEINLKLDLLKEKIYEPEEKRIDNVVRPTYEVVHKASEVQQPRNSFDGVRKIKVKTFTTYEQKTAS